MDVFQWLQDWINEHPEAFVTGILGLITTILAWGRKSKDDTRDNDRADFDSTLNAWANRLENVEDRFDSLSADHAKTQRRVGELEASNKAKTQQINMLTNQIQTLTRERDELRRELAEVRQRADSAEERADHAEQTVEELRSKVEAKDQKIEVLQQRIRKLEDESHPEEI